MSYKEVNRLKFHEVKFG